MAGPSASMKRRMPQAKHYCIMHHVRYSPFCCSCARDKVVEDLLEENKRLRDQIDLQNLTVLKSLVLEAHPCMPEESSMRE